MKDQLPLIVPRETILRTTKKNVSLWTVKIFHDNVSSDTFSR